MKRDLSDRHNHPLQRANTPTKRSLFKRALFMSIYRFVFRSIYRREGVYVEKKPINGYEKILIYV